VGETRIVAEGRQTIIAVGLGEPDRLSAEAIRRAAAALARSTSQARRAAFVLPVAGASRGRPAPSLSPGALGQAIAEGASLATYQFSPYKTSATPSKLRRLTVVVPESERREVTAGLLRGTRVARAVALARDLVNEPARALTPRRLAELATAVAAGAGLDVKVLDEEQIAEERLGGLAGVAQGSDEPPRLIRLTYEPAGGATATVALVGKGITFDSGGLSLKTSDGMMSMKTDMSGAAAVLATMSALRDLEVDVRVIGIMPTTENMPSGHAIKPGDVLRARNGKTIEVLNTDAEGRLVLADGLSLAAEESPAAIIDLATLTGACVVALGRQIAGLMGNDDRLIARVKDASDRSGEQVWHLPLPDEYRRHIDSDVADIKNVGNAGQAGALAAGLFLREFVGQIPWAHLDIAGPARSDADEGYQRKGGTGFGVRTLLELLSSFSAS
jgi:leucyl aminopeptidase